MLESISKPCHDCPWLVGSPRFVWPVEHFHDLRLGTLQPTGGKVTACLHAPRPSTCAGILGVIEHSRVQMRIARTRNAVGLFHLCNRGRPIAFPSFEAMADANGAGLFEWTGRLQRHDRVVHFRCGTALEVLKVTRVSNDIIQTQGAALTYRFNALGYELHSVIDSRILPATRAALELVSPRESLEFD